MNNQVVNPVGHVSPMLLTVTLMSTLGSNAGVTVEQVGRFMDSTHSYRIVGEGPTLSLLSYARAPVPTKSDFEAIAIQLASQQIAVDEEIRSLTSANFLNYLD